MNGTSREYGLPCVGGPWVSALGIDLRATLELLQISERS
jgi:hypothetical protein